LIAASQRRFEAGQRELSIGHLDRARAEFDQALEVLLGSKYGARYDPRLREHFDRLVDQISAYEVTALAQGDGFTEKRYEPASIDALLELSTTFTPASPAGSAALKERVASDLEHTAHDIDIPLNERVLTYVELFQGRLREWIADGLNRGSRYLPMIQNVFRAEGLPLDLAYVPLIESAFKPNAVSRAKAKGVWQFMSGTAMEHGLKRDWYLDERSDPEKATVAAAKYLRTLSGMFDGDWHLALASYNGGPGRVQRAMKRGRAEDFWTLAAKPKLLPRETREYVPMILAAIVIARNPAQYGFDMGGAPPVEYDKVTVPGPVDLRRVAELAGVSVNEIQELNPELRRWTTPVRYPDYQLKVPRGAGEALAATLTDNGDVQMASLKWHTVRKGETLATIARKLRVSRTDLAEANYLSSKARVKPGQNLIIPVEPSALLAGRPDRPAAVTASRPIVPAGTVVEEATSPERVRIVYQVKRGDTLSSVARLFKTTVASLKLWNHLRTDQLVAGARLTVFKTKPQG
jgi:membrane-bound lytic murein transglycosylase D